MSLLRFILLKLFLNTYSQLVLLNYFLISNNFYVLPTRAWELIAGSILSYFEIQTGTSI